MPVIRITKKFHFEAAHALWNYNGLCRNIHGHSYKLYVTLIGQPNKNKKSPGFGMIMDFGKLKSLINNEIVNVFDHSLIIYKEAENDIIRTVSQMHNRLLVVDYQPTCENMTADFANRIIKVLPKDIKLYSLRLYETATAFCEWFAEDNK